MTDFNQGVTFGTFHTRQDWGLILESDHIGFPTANGIVDSFDIFGQPNLDPKVNWTHRQLSFTFGIAGLQSRWPAVIRAITSAIQGKKMRIIRDCEPDVAYIGRCNVDTYEYSMRIGKFSISVDAEPYTEAVTPTLYTLSDPTNTRHTIQYDGAFPTPCKATITPSGAIATLVVGGLACNPLTLEKSRIAINGLKTNKPVVIDGVKKLITEDGANKYADAEIWNFPMLTPGVNTITFSSTNHSTVIEVYKRFI